MLESCEDSNDSGSQNSAPEYAITTPSFGAEIEKRTTVTISVEASDSDGNLREIH
jgi:hypothetical protein